ncbi:MAG: Two component signal transduction histidine kinase [Frankiales bacterium]|nr:Two component signal transduction histidine kinase [Frankiales bacterium]
MTTASQDLGGGLGGQLPWISLTGGAVLTIAAALVAAGLVRRHRAAELAATTIGGLYERLDGLYAEQRSIATALQHALLPTHDVDLPGLDVACRYVAGADGVDVGGDWYSLVKVDEDRFAFAVGDVSGRGIGAAAVMARLHFTMRAYLLEGHAPDVVLARCARQIDLSADGHFATVVVGLADCRPAAWCSRTPATRLRCSRHGRGPASSRCRPACRSASGTTSTRWSPSR